MAKTFTNSERFLAYMQERYGSANFSKWQQIRKQFYSYILYPQAGSTQLNFFGFGINGSGTQGRQFTNMPKAGSFGQVHFLLKQIRCKILMLDSSLSVPTAATDVTNSAADFINGFLQAGMLNLSIGDKKYLELPRPFLYAPPADGQIELAPAAMTFTLTEGTPNTQLNTVNGIPYAMQSRRSESGYLVDPNILIEAEQAFELSIGYPSGAVPVIATTPYTASNFAVGVSLDGILFRPVQ